MAEVVAAGMGGRLEFLSVRAPWSEARRHHALRAVDGAVVHRRQYRRGHRNRRSAPAGAVLPGAGCADRGRRNARPRGTRRRRSLPRWLEWLRDRAATERDGTRAALDQSAYLLLLPCRVAHDKRAGAR